MTTRPMAPTIEQALWAEIQAHKQALDHALTTLEWLTLGHHRNAPDHGLSLSLTCRACEGRDYIRLHLAGWAAPTTGASVPTGDEK